MMFFMWDNGLNNTDSWKKLMKKTLLLGWGNVDRQDDGVAWHVLMEVASRLGLPVPPDADSDFPANDGQPDFLFVLQIVPELSEIVAQYERVCFVDAHTGNIAEEVSMQRIEAGYQRSPLTHHMTAATLLALTGVVCNSTPQAVLVSIRGYEFGFSHSLSERTASLVSKAVEYILQWLNEQ